MFRWIMLALTLFGLALVFLTRSPGVLGLGLLLGLIGVVGFVFSLAADRVASSARPDSAMASVEDLTTLRKLRATSANKPSSDAAATPAGGTSDTAR